MIKTTAVIAVMRTDAVSIGLMILILAVASNGAPKQHLGASIFVGVNVLFQTTKKLIKTCY